MAGYTGKFTDTFVVGEMSPGALTVTAGYGSDTTKAQVEVYIQRYFTVMFDKNGGKTNADAVTVSVK